MSRLGKQPISIPAKANVSISGRKVTISSGDKTLEYEHRSEVKVTWNEDEKSLVVSIDEKDANNRQVRAYWGMTRALLQNMVTGVTEGFSKTLEVVGVGYTAAINGQKLDLKVGYANTISMPIPMGLDVQVDRQFIRINGPDKHMVGQFAAAVRDKRKPEPYNGKGIKYLEEVIRRKQGKAFGA
ncbi:MAG: 50S ribosomal protein L6 [Phycisphaerales bacterium]